jgi:hypothetical protein
LAVEHLLAARAAPSIASGHSHPDDFPRYKARGHYSRLVMGTALRVLGVLVAGAALSLVITWFTVIHSALGGSLNDGPWQTNLMAGSSEGDIYSRARVALHGLFALNRSETLYYTAQRDDDGDTLDGHCIYEIVGQDPDTRWWSITAYGADDFLIPNRANRYSVSKNSVARREDGSFIAIAARGPSGANWIPVDRGPFTLTLRLYNPGLAVQANPAGANLPSIKKTSCE